MFDPANGRQEQLQQRDKLSTMTDNQASNVISSPAFRASAGRKAAKSLDDQV